MERFVASRLTHGGTASSESIFSISVASKPIAKMFLEKWLNLITFLMGREHTFIQGLHLLNTSVWEAQPKPRYTEQAPPAGASEWTWHPH